MEHHKSQFKELRLLEGGESQPFSLDFVQNTELFFGKTRISIVARETRANRVTTQ